MDADGEDKPQDVPRLLAAIGDRRSIVVVGERTKRSEDLVFRTFYQIYWLMFFLLTGHRIGFGNFLALPAVSARRVANMGELWLSLPATILRSRIPIINVPTERGSRLHGTSQMSLVSLVVHGLRAMAVFVEYALTRIILGALALLLLCAVASAVAIFQKFIGMATPGWVTTVVGVSLVILWPPSFCASSASPSTSRGAASPLRRRFLHSRPRSTASYRLAPSRRRTRYFNAASRQQHAATRTICKKVERAGCATALGRGRHCRTSIYAGTLRCCAQCAVLHPVRPILRFVIL